MEAMKLEGPLDHLGNHISFERLIANFTKETCGKQALSLCEASTASAQG